MTDILLPFTVSSSMNKSDSLRIESDISDLQHRKAEPFRCMMLQTMLHSFMHF